jgi:two-component system, OmpR family, sensor histidine kinase KdpD
LIHRIELDLPAFKKPLMFLGAISRRMEYLLGSGFICAVSALCFLFTRYMGPEVVAFILLVALSLIAMFFDILPVLLAATLSALIWDYFFLHPRFNLRVGNTEARIMLSMYFVIAMVSAVLTFKIRQMEKLSRQKEERIENIRLYNTLLNSLSHEFRTPLATIIAATDNLMASPSLLSEEIRNNLVSEISVASLRLNRQVENLLNMSRLESGFIRLRRDWCDINELADDVLHRLQESLKDYTVKTEIPDDFPLFKLDYGLMEQVLYNLMYNATQYTPVNSCITIAASFSGSGLLITVEDNGPGFPEREIPKVFDKFYRLAHAPVGGTGLGLSIAKGFVEAHGGLIELRNREQGGAIFTITINTERLDGLPDGNA